VRWLFAGCGRACCWRELFHFRAESAHPRTGSRESAGYVQEIHNGHPHEAIDIHGAERDARAAVVSGTVRKLFLSKPGGNTIYLFDEQQVYCYYYAHLNGYAKGLREGMQSRAETSSGLWDRRAMQMRARRTCILPSSSWGRKKQWWKGQAVDPYPGLVAAVQRAQ
jgi:hypothetical protein